jgi:hypothetical protein
MTQYLVAAEADKIQDFIFRASRLREVFGGSNLLSRFCRLYRDLPNWLDPQPTQTIVADGGSFRLSYANQADAERASRQLADLYYQATGCGLSVAKPVEWDGTSHSFAKANPKASQWLRVAKRSRGVGATAHLPYIAFCSSTGLEFAAEWTNANGYLSNYSERKRQERSKERHAFLDEFFSLLPGHEPEQNRWLDPAEDPDDLGQRGGYDPRNYVAYLVADGNGMGKRFDQISDPSQLFQLSIRLTQVTRNSLAAPTKLLIKHHPGKNSQIAPVLPLLLGGDDLFALLPAPNALSFAQEFCCTFELEMMKTLQELQLNMDPRPTMSAAIVICKASYPFRLAHERGEQLLKKAKQAAKENNPPWSTVNFEVIIGNDWGGEEESGNFHLTQRPYFVTPTPEVATQYAIPDQTPGLTIQDLLAIRYQLNSLPQKRRTQLRTHFDQENLPMLSALKEWATEVDDFIDRTGKLRGSSPESAKQLKAAMETLGMDANTSHYWRRKTSSGKPRYYNAMPDILDSWAFLYDLTRNRKEYTEVMR